MQNKDERERNDNLAFNTMPVKSRYGTELNEGVHLYVSI